VENAIQSDDDAAADVAINTVESWYSENERYDYKTKNWIPGTGKLQRHPIGQVGKRPLFV
jgi:hypothetical protein